MKINKHGLEIVKKYEGLRLQAYLCPANVPTIGYGHTGGVKLGQKCTEDQANKWLLEDIKEAEKAVTELVKVKLNEDQFAALVSFTFNLGVGKFRNSTMLKKLNAGNYHGAAKQFPLWRHAAGKVQGGLVKRRKEEMDLFLA